MNSCIEYYLLATIGLGHCHCCNVVLEFLFPSILTFSTSCSLCEATGQILRCPQNRDWLSVFGGRFLTYYSVLMDWEPNSKRYRGLVEGRNYLYSRFLTLLISPSKFGYLQYFFLQSSLIKNHLESHFTYTDRFLELIKLWCYIFDHFHTL